TLAAIAATWESVAPPPVPELPVPELPAPESPGAVRPVPARRMSALVGFSARPARKAAVAIMSMSTRPATIAPISRPGRRARGGPPPGGTAAVGGHGGGGGGGGHPVCPGVDGHEASVSR